MALAAGDLAFVGFNGDSDNDFAIVILEDIDGSGTPVTITFTSNEWDGSAFNSGEGVLTWTINTQIAAGTVISFNDIKNTATATVSEGSLSGSMTLHTGNSGQYDQAILAFTGTTGSPETFLAGISNSTFAAAGVTLSTTGLTVGDTAFEFVNTTPRRPHFAAYEGTRIGTKEALRASISDVQNWFGVRSGGDNSDGRLPFDNTPFVECFLEGTRILSDRGEIPVEALNIGDYLFTATGQLKPIKWIGRQTIVPGQVDNPLRSYPICIKAGALGHNLPHRDLYVSPDHALLVEGLLINAGALVNDWFILQTAPTEPFVYYHVELYQHSLLVAEGAATESYLPQRENRCAYDNEEEYRILYPHDSSLAYWPMKYPRVSSKRQLPRFISKQLKQVAQVLASEAVVA